MINSFLFDLILFLLQFCKVTRSLSLALNRANLNETALNAFVALKKHPQTELLVHINMPARPLRRRVSMAGLNENNGNGLIDLNDLVSYMNE